MYSQFINGLPQWRDDIVEPLEIPERIPVTPYVDTVTDLLVKRDFEDEFILDRRSPVSSAYSLALSRAMTDSDIDYELHRKMRNKHLMDSWYEMRKALDRFSLYYLDAIKPYMITSSGYTDCLYSIDGFTSSFRSDVKDKMETFFEEECRVFDGDDPEMLALEEALESLDLKTIYSEIEDEEQRLQRMYLIDPY